MSKPRRDPQHPAIAAAQHLTYPLTESGRVAPEINGDIENLSADAANELSLGLLDLIMETAHNVLKGERLIVLDKAANNTRFRQNSLVIAFEKVTSTVFKDLRFKDLDFRNAGR